MPKHIFKVGNKLGVGGVRPGSGHPSDEFKRKCRNIIGKPEFLAFLEGVYLGKKVEWKRDQSNKPYCDPATVKDRLKAADMLMDRGFGKPNQEVELGGKDGETLKIEVVNHFEKKESK